MPQSPLSRRWNSQIEVYDHLGVHTDTVLLKRAHYLYETGDYIATGTKKRIEALVHHGPPDGRTVKDEHAMKPKGSQRPVYRHKSQTGRQWWELKDQRHPWNFAGDINLDPGHETPSTGGPDI